MSINLNDAVLKVRECIPSYFGSVEDFGIVFKDVLHEEIMRDLLFAGDIFVDALPLTENKQSNVQLLKTIIDDVSLSLLKQDKIESIKSEKELPNSYEAEQYVIGAILLDYKAYEKIKNIIDSYDFCSLRNQVIFYEIIKLSKLKKPFDVVSILERFKDSPSSLSMVGGKEYLFELLHNIPSASNIVKHANILKEKSRLRKLINISKEIISIAKNDSFDDAQVFEMVENCFKDIKKLEN